MYLPQWVVAAIAVFNAASDQPTAHKTPSLTDNKDGFIVAFMQVSDGGIYHLSVKPKEGEVLKMTKAADGVTLWNVSLPTAIGQFIRLHDNPELCLTAKTRKDGGGRETTESGPVTLEPCPKGEIDPDNPPIGSLWETSRPRFYLETEMQVAWDSRPIFYNKETHNVSLLLDQQRGDTEWFTFFPPPQKESDTGRGSSL